MPHMLSELGIAAYSSYHLSGKKLTTLPAPIEPILIAYQMCGQNNIFRVLVLLSRCLYPSDLGKGWKMLLSHVEILPNLYLPRDALESTFYVKRRLRYGTTPEDLSVSTPCMEHQPARTHYYYCRYVRGPAQSVLLRVL